jgi:hypothetical protein
MMKSIVVTSIVFGLVFAAALAGMLLRPILPQNLLGSEDKEVVRLTTGVITTMSGLVLGMLVSSAKSSYDARKNELAEMSAKIVAIDRLLAGYGPEIGEIRTEFRRVVEVGFERIWPHRGALPSDLKPAGDGQTLFEQVQLLEPKNDRQAAAIAKAVSLTLDIQQTQWLMFLKTKQTALPLPLLLVLVSWLAAIFFSFGLFVSPNAIVLVTFACGALGVSFAIFIILAMFTPFSGILRISPAPILETLAEMRR